jgi:hypothetical protein
MKTTHFVYSGLFFRPKKNDAERYGNRRNAKPAGFCTLKTAKQWQSSFYAIERNIRKPLTMKHCLAWIRTMTK